MAGANTFPTPFPQLILDQPITYKEDPNYEIIFIKKLFSIIVAEINIKQIQKYGLQIQLFHIIERILKELPDMGIPPENGMFATIIITCPFPQNNLLRILELTVQDLNCKFHLYHFFYRENLICYKPIQSLFHAPSSRLTINYSPNTQYKY
jgi:hypothetical protein